MPLFKVFHSRVSLRYLLELLKLETWMALVASPEWTDFQKKNGLDPLGMRQSSINLYQSLLPGISNVTLRIRYYGLYVWLSNEYAREERHTDPERWKRYVRRAEALYALTAVNKGGESGIAGSQWAGRKLQDHQKLIAFADDAEPGSDTYYLKQAWGAFGAAYGSQLLETGLFDESYNHSIPLPTEDLGRRLAESVAKTNPKITELFINCANRGDVSISELNELAEFTPSNIDLSSEERDLYEELLFEFEGRNPSALANRKQTLGLILEAALSLGKTPTEDDIRWWVYWGELRETVLQKASLVEHRTRWWTYQSNELAHIAYEAIMKFLLDVMEEAYCIAPSSLVSEVLNRVKSVAKPWPSSWSKFLLSIEGTDDDEETLVEAIRKGTRHQGITDPYVVWQAIKLLALVYQKTVQSEEITKEFGHLDTRTFQSIHSELDFLSAHSDDDFDSAIASLISERIIKRHLWVALKKLRYQGDYTFLFETEGELLRYRVKDGPVLTTPRLSSGVTFLSDIGLIDANGITTRGEARLKQI